MGNGIGTMGSGLAGWVPPGEVPPPGPTAAPWALKYDAATGDFVMLDDGRYDEVHPVTHEVMLSLAIELGAVAVVPELGSTLNVIPLGDESTMTIDARRRTERALAERLRAKDIEILDVRAFAANGWRLNYSVSFLNLREYNAETGLPQQHDVAFGE